MKKTVAALLAGILLALLALTGCDSQETQFVDVKKIIYISRSTDFGGLQMYVLTSDCTVKEYKMGFDDFIHYDLFAGELPPKGEYKVVGEYKISEEDWNTLINTINENNFAELPEELPTGRVTVTDAPVTHMQVETTDGFYRTGGYAAGFGDDEASKRFNAIEYEFYVIIEKYNPEP